MSITVSFPKSTGLIEESIQVTVIKGIPRKLYRNILTVSFLIWFIQIFTLFGMKYLVRTEGITTIILIFSGYILSFDTTLVVERENERYHVKKYIGYSIFHFRIWNGYDTDLQMKIIVANRRKKAVSKIQFFVDKKEVLMKFPNIYFDTMVEEIDFIGIQHEIVSIYTGRTKSKLL